VDPAARHTPEQSSGKSGPVYHLGLADLTSDVAPPSSASAEVTVTRQSNHNVLCALALLLTTAVPAVAQTDRTIAMYDTEFGAKLALLYEEGGFWGTGFLVEGGVKVCEYGDWRCQAIGELSIVRFGDFDSTYKQVAGGIRFGSLVAPRARAFVQFQIGWQNDGFEDSNNATVFMPGGGFNYALTEQIDMQVMVDIPFARYDGGTFTQLRLSFGVAVPLGVR
jgi:hypothetical protein